jgi:uncharacterized protein (TIGR03435 family)
MSRGTRLAPPAEDVVRPSVFVASWMNLVVAMVCGGIPLRAQPQSPIEFEVVSIRRHVEPSDSGGMRTPPDGTFTMTNSPMVSIIGTVSTERILLRNVVGAPEWLFAERYDLIAKPPQGATRDQYPQMWRAMFAERMKLAWHLEEREQTTFALVLARRDGRLGPQLRPSTLECGPPPASTPPAAPPTRTDPERRCGLSMSGTSIVSGGIALDTLVQSLSGLAGGPVTNRTGLQGFYAMSLTFSPQASRPEPGQLTVDAAPDFFTALQEQLGLRLEPEKGTVPVLVIDHIERPSPN